MGHRQRNVAIHALLVALLAGLALAAAATRAATATARTATAAGLGFTPRSLNGVGNNLAHPLWGVAGSPYRRLAPNGYVDGISAMAGGPNPRYISNRIFNSLGVDLFSERNLSQWAWVWGQFLDHGFGLARSGQTDASVVFAPDPLESFRNDLGTIQVTRDAAAPGTGTSRSNPREQTNTVSSYIDGWQVYGGTRERLDWLRSGRPGHLAANLLLPGGYLPRAGARGDVATAPSMQLAGQLTADPQNAVVAGDVRANENAELTAVHTLFAREHNRIVAMLPRTLNPEAKFQIARRVVGAEEQYITYSAFLPALGVHLPSYRGYNAGVDPELSNEFATVAYRAHSMVNGEEHIDVSASRYSSRALASLGAMGVGAADVPSRHGLLQLTLSQNAAFFDPAVMPAIGLGPVLAGLSDEPGYKNDEQIDDSLRSVLFEFPGPDVHDPASCIGNLTAPGCFQGVVDLGAIDIQRARDNGMPRYNRLRVALGLPPARSFTDITGEPTDRMPPGISANDPRSLEFVSLRDFYDQPIAAGSSRRAVYAQRRTTLAARLRAVYGSVQNVDAFVGMMSEPHVPGSDLGPLQLALWRRQFEALRDGDRFFYRNDPALRLIQRRYGITYRHTLGRLIALDAGVSATSMPANVFFAPTPPRH